ncbi:MAG: hypothetical protein K8T20_08535 [Planctomycetes bacterium]|nr:hypothetical protein [Planctomycetota bacterium]
MITGRRFLTLALVVGLCALAAAGCSRRRSKGSTTTTSTDIFTTDEFPGASVQDNNVADDKQAFSVAGADVSSGLAADLQVIYNGDRCVAIATYTVIVPGGTIRYAHYYDGSWTPPVALGAFDCVLTSVGSTAAVAFLNTGDHPSDLAQERNGDAIILWTADDGAGAAGDGVNRNLWATYFHAQNAGDIALNYGFEPFAQRLSNEDDTNEDVSTFGFVSDGLCGEARWDDGFVNYQWGDETTEIIAFWRQSQDNDPVALYQDDEYWAFSRFDLGAAVTLDLPLTGSTATRGSILGFGASDSGLTSEESEVFSEFISYNNVLFFKVSDDADAGSLGGYAAAAQTGYGGALSAEDKITVQEVAFGLGTATVSSPATLHAATPSAAIGDMNQCNADYAMDKGGFVGRMNSVYGSDQGLATLTVFSLQLVTDPDTVFGQVTADGRLGVTEINESTGALIAGGASFLDGEDSDISDSVFFFDSRMSRNGDYIWAAWLENIDAGGAGATTEDQTGVFAAEYITTRIQEDGTYPVPPGIGSTLSGFFQLNAIITLVAVGQPVAGFEFQSALGYVCGLQSDPDVMHIFFEHSDTTGDAIWETRLTADLDPLTGGCSPSVTVTLWEGFSLEADQVDWIQYGPRVNHYDWKSIDSGDGGDVLTFYEQDIDATGSTDYRMHSEKNGVAGGKIEIDSFTPDRQVSNFDLVYYAATEPGSSIGVFDILSLEDSDDRPKGADAVDVFFSESQVSEVDGLPLFYRTRRFSPGDLSVPFGDQFTPSAGSFFEDPFYPGVPGQSMTSNSLIDIAGDGDMPVNGSTVGLYFVQGSRVYYQESDSSADNGELSWANDEGVSNPFLVDDDNDAEVQNFAGLFLRSCACNTLDCSMVFWTKAYGSGSGGGTSLRLQVRVRDGNGN